MNITEEQKTAIVQRVYNMLVTDRFEIWHNTKFQDYVLGEENAPNSAEIKQQLRQLLRF